MRIELKLWGFFAFNATGSGKSIVGIFGVLALLVAALVVGGPQVIPFTLIVLFVVVYVMTVLHIQRRRASSTV